MKRMIYALYGSRFMSTEQMQTKEEKRCSLCERQDKIRMKLFAQMSEEMKDLFRQYDELESQIVSELGETDYARGLRDGLRMGAWALGRDAEADI